MTRHRGFVLAAMVVAAALRLSFVRTTPPLPLYWDEVHYHTWATGYADAWKALWEPAPALVPLRTAFLGSLQKGEAYSAFVGLIYAIVGPQPKAVFVAQALLDAATCLFVYGIARRVGGAAVGGLALLLAATYPPFIFSAARLQSETFTSFLYLGGLWAFVSPPGRGGGWQFVAGLLTALAMLARPAFQFLFPVLMLMVFIVQWDEPRRRRVRLALTFAAGFFLLIGPRLLLTYALAGRPLWSGTTDPSINAYAGIVFDNLGWRTDHLAFADPPRDQLLAVLRERGAKQPSNEDYRRATVRCWLHHPIQSSQVMLHKVYQVWAHPYNDSQRTFLVGMRWQRRWHQILLVLAAIGLPLALSKWRVGVPLIVTMLYVWTTYLGVQIEVRYVVTAMPLILCLAAAAALELAGGIAMARRSWVARVALATIVVVSLLLHGFSLPRLLDLLPSLSPESAHHLRVAAAMIVLVAGATVVFQLLRSHWPRAWALAAAGVPLLFAVSLCLVARPLAATWRQWQCPLASGRGAVRQEFSLPAPLPIPRTASVRLDLTSNGRGGDLVVLVNGHEARRFVGGPNRENAVPTERFYEEIFAGQGRPSHHWHAWYSVPIAIESLKPGATIAVEARVESDTGTGEVRVLGDYPAGDAAYDGPSLLSPENSRDTSVYRYVGDGDFRMRRRLTIPVLNRSSFSDGHAWSSTDLSPAAGRQYGRYRIFLVLTYADGQVIIF